VETTATESQQVQSQNINTTVVYLESIGPSMSKGQA